MEYVARKCVITTTGEKRNLRPKRIVEQPQGKASVRKVETWEDVNTGEIFPTNIVRQIPITPYEEFGVECGDGWSAILQPLFDYIKAHNEGKGEDDPDYIQVLQVKEKFGSLRFYVSHTTDELSQMIDDAEELSYKTCELCGSTTDVGMITQGWISVRCRKCMEAGAGGHYVRVWKSNDTGKKYRFHPDGAEEVPPGEITEF